MEKTLGRYAVGLESHLMVYDRVWGTLRNQHEGLARILESFELFKRTVYKGDVAEMQNAGCGLCATVAKFLLDSDTWEPGTPGGPLAGSPVQDEGG